MLWPYARVEDHMCQIAPEGFVREGSPDGADALVWAFTELMLEDQASVAMFLTKRHP